MAAEDSKAVVVDGTGPARPRNRIAISLRQLLLAAVTLAWLALIFAYVWPDHFRNGSRAALIAGWAALMIRVFDFHIGLALAGAGVAAIVLRARRLAAAAFVPAILILVPEVWSSLPRKMPSAVGESLKVMSVNLLYENHHTGPIIAQIGAENPDVVLFQEYTPEWGVALRAALMEQMPYVAEQPQDGAFGVAVFSRRPFVSEPRLDLPLGDMPLPQARAVIGLDGREVAVYCIHIPPPASLFCITEQRSGFYDLLKLVKSEKRPVILSGDFNFTNSTPFAGELHASGFRDAHEICGAGRGTTWPASWIRVALGGWMPGIRIDHVYLNAGLTAIESRVLPDTGSDHRAIVARVGFAR